MLPVFPFVAAFVSIFGLSIAEVPLSVGASITIKVLKLEENVETLVVHDVPALKQVALIDNVVRTKQARLELQASVG